MGIIFIVGTVQAFFIEFILLNKMKKSLADKWLAVWMFFIGAHLFLFYLYYIEFHLSFPYLMGLILPLPLIHGPFLLLYVNALIKGKEKLALVELLHFLPALVYYGVLSPKFFWAHDTLLQYVIEADASPPVYGMVFGIMNDVSGVVYITWALITLRKHKTNIGHVFSFTDSINLNWLRNLILGMVLIWVAVIAMTFVDALFANSTFDFSTIIYVNVTIFVFLIGYHGTRQGIIFSDHFKLVDGQNEKLMQTKYQKSSINKDLVDEYLERLLSYMEETKPFLESKITLPQLAEKLDLHHNYLSQIINEKLGKNFYDFVNQYRVDEFKRRLSNNEAKNLTLLAVAYDSGFSSKSSFNEVFKKFTGVTPSRYARELVHTDNSI